MTYQHQLYLHNNLSGTKEEFIPIDSNQVRMYVCGMTVYDYCHIGHARVLVVFDIFYRYLSKIYGEEHVRYVRNVTDIDDKIIARANEGNEHFSDLTHRFIQYMHEDSEKLGVLSPSEEPLATGHMQQIIDMVASLVEKKFAYQGSNGDVFYSVSHFAEYGKLSGKQLDELQAGERVAVETAKRDPLDFVLWKRAKENEPSWESPWGLGRPGWHIECSAMSNHCLGDHFDIHGGGLDLQFPHHENEIAQSEAANGCKFVNYWLHNGFVRIDDEKMSKSLGNFFTIREVMERYDPEVIRYFILTSHYRSPLNYSDAHLDNAKAALTSLYNSLRGIPLLNEGVEGEASSNFFRVMDDDLNTSEALAILFDLAHQLNRVRESDPEHSSAIATELTQLGSLLGILQRDPEQFLQGGDELDSIEIASLVEARRIARTEKRWTDSDQIRDQLLEMGIILEDGAAGTTWRKG